jgi:hypothetical protein
MISIEAILIEARMSLRGGPAVTGPFFGFDMVIVLLDQHGWEYAGECCGLPRETLLSGRKGEAGLCVS